MLRIDVEVHLEAFQTDSVYILTNNKLSLIDQSQGDIENLVMFSSPLANLVPIILKTVIIKAVHSPSLLSNIFTAKRIPRVLGRFFLI
ncbi:hypothetical protein BJK05_07330 [Pectobacterium polaris]|nr:hypothetical protein BJK05_07330 [Pectobacterium polaris]